MTTNLPDAAAVVVHYDSVNTLIKTVSSLRRSLPAERIIIVDNSSSLAGLTDGIEAVILDDGFNHGYAAGVNLGVRYVSNHLTEVREVLVCTHETIFRDDAISTLFETARKYPNGHLIGPRLVTTNDAGEEKTWSDGGSYSIPLLYPKHCLTKGGVGVISVKWIDGAAFVIDVKTWQRLGGIPEEFFMYMEDVAMGELCRRFRIPVLVDLSAVVEQTANGPSRFLAIRNRTLLARRYMTPSSKMTVLADIYMRQIAMMLHPKRNIRQKSYESRKAVREATEIDNSLRKIL